MAMATSWTLPDLMELSNAQLVAIARAQPELWPHSHPYGNTLTRLSLSHVKKETIARTLVNAGYERIPVPDAPNSLTLSLHAISEVSLLVYLTDGINPNHVRKTVERFPVQPERRIDCQPGTCRISTEDLLRDLSDWIDARHGAGLPTTIRVGIPNAVKPDFIEYFAEGPAGLIYDADVSFDTLTARFSDGLQLVVEAGASEPFERSARTDDDEEDLDGRSSHNNTGKQQSDHKPNDKPLDIIRERMDADIRYMKSQIVAKPGYSAFKALRHRVVPNPSIPEYWKFVVDILEEYAEARNPETSRRIFRKTISHAIGIQPTWLREIEEGYCLLQTHIGNPAVQRHLEDTESHGGSKGMLVFLRNL